MRAKEEAYQQKWDVKNQTVGPKSPFSGKERSWGKSSSSCSVPSKGLSFSHWWVSQRLHQASIGYALLSTSVDWDSCFAVSVYMRRLGIGVLTIRLLDSFTAHTTHRMQKPSVGRRAQMGTEAVGSGLTYIHTRVPPACSLIHMHTAIARATITAYVPWWISNRPCKGYGGRDYTALSPLLIGAKRSLLQKW